MDNHSLLYTAIWIFGLLGLATIVHAVAKKLKFSFSVGLLTAGFLLNIGSGFFGIDISPLVFSPEIVFYVFLPTLIFESSYHLNFRHFRGVFLEVCTLATLGLLFSVIIIGAGLHFVFDLPFGAALLFGALISATDPVAVLSIFKELRAPKKLATIVDGESLLNDGTALVLFQFLLVHWATFNSETIGPLYGALFLKNIFLGISVGVVFGWIFSHAIARSVSKGVQITLSLILAHVTFLFSEGILHVSGILATMAAGMVMGGFGKRKLSKETKESFTSIWQFLEFISNSLIFLLLGIRLSQVPILENWLIVLATIVLTIFIARPISVFISFFITNFFRKKEDRSPFSYQLITVWGGIRGALAAAALLLIPDDFPYISEFFSMTTGVILATFFLKATTIPFWLRKFKLIQLTNTENLQCLEAKILVHEEIRCFLHRILNKKYISQEIYSFLLHQYGENESSSEKELQILQENLVVENSEESEKILTHFALGIEIKAYKQLFELREISEFRSEVLLGSIFRQIDRLEKGCLPIKEMYKKKYAPNIPEKKEIKNFFGRWYSRKRKNVILERFQHYRARRISSWQVILDFQNLQQKHALFADSNIVTQILKRYKSWHKNAIKKVEHLQNKFPDIIGSFRKKMAINVCLRKEEIIKTELFEKGLISEKVFEYMKKDIEERKKINSKT